MTAAGEPVDIEAGRPKGLQGAVHGSRSHPRLRVSIDRVMSTVTFSRSDGMQMTAPWSPEPLGASSEIVRLQYDVGGTSLILETRRGDEIVAQLPLMDASRPSAVGL